MCNDYQPALLPDNTAGIRIKYLTISVINNIYLFS
jgi:hypothetical protein